MKLLYVVEKMSGKGGMERILTDKMNYLAEHTAHEIVLLLLWHDKQPLAYKLSNRIRIIHLNVPYKLWFLVLLRFNRIVKQERPDLSIFTWVMGAFLAAFGLCEGARIYEAHRARYTMRYQWLQRLMEKKVDAVVALTEQDAGYYQKARRVEVIPNFTAMSLQNDSDLTSHTCLAIGRLIEAKNFTRLIDIWQKVNARHPDWRLDIVGDGPEESLLQKKIISSGLQDSITLHHATNEVEKYYRQSSIFLLTSKFEGLSMVIIEAMTCGLPVVSVDCDFGPRHLICNEVNGYLTPYDDDEAMAEAICTLMDDKALRISFGQASKERAARFQPAPIMSKWIQLFANIMANKQA